MINRAFYFTLVIDIRSLCEGKGRDAFCVDLAFI
jgi:hypothetical protein